MDKEMTVDGKEYTIIKLLGHGKGGYSYLAENGGQSVVLKQIHHEPCDYYSFGNKIESECDPQNDCSWKLLEKVGLKREAHFRQNIFFHKNENGDPIWKDTYVYATVESDYSI